MTQVSVYRFRKYDITTDDYVTSTRMATHEKVAQICAEIIPGTKREIDASLRRLDRKKFRPTPPRTRQPRGTQNSSCELAGWSAGVEAPDRHLP
jgi:hypothetical protein